MALLGSVVLAGCAAGTVAPPLTTGAVGGARLSAPQVAAVTDAARQMTGDPAATAHGLRVRANADGPGVHVCGYVNSAAGGPDTPLFVELLDTDGKIAAARGQTGSTPANLAKVRFMCRRHGDW